MVLNEIENTAIAYPCGNNGRVSAYTGMRYLRRNDELGFETGPEVLALALLISLKQFQSPELLM